VYVRLLGRSRAVIAGVLQATSLTVIVAATRIGLQLGVVSRASAAALIAAGLLSVVISPTLGLVLLGRETRFCRAHSRLRRLLTARASRGNAAVAGESAQVSSVSRRRG
jgi:hypothetical protein